MLSLRADQTVGSRSARTFVQPDNPAALTEEIRRFVKDHPLPGES
jgi:hypothetical protein